MLAFLLELPAVATVTATASAATAATSPTAITFLETCFTCSSLLCPDETCLRWRAFRPSMGRKTPESVGVRQLGSTRGPGRRRTRLRPVVCSALCGGRPRRETPGEGRLREAPA